MKPRTICHPEALADWRANDERHFSPYPVFRETLEPHEVRAIRAWEFEQELKRERNNANNNTLPEKQKETRRVLARDIEKAIEREIGRCRPVRKEG